MKQEYTKVWGDTVSLPELFMASVIGVTVTMGLYMVVRIGLERFSEVSPGVISGYALIAGISGCFISGMITGRKFKPKRMVIEGTEKMDLESVLTEAGTSVEIEAIALSKEKQEVIAEMEDLELYSLLSLIPEGSPNYKPEYREYVERKNLS